MSKELEQDSGAARSAPAAACAADRLGCERRVPLARAARRGPWRQRAQAGFIPCATCKDPLSDLRGIDGQIERVEQNTRQFIEGKPANNVLLTGARGTGKSSLIKGLLNKYSKQGLRLIEVEKHDLVDLPYIVDLVAAAPERFVLFCDDLTFHGAEDGYIALKVVLDGSVSAASENLLIYATSNRRHLMPEYMAENLETQATSATRSIPARPWRRRFRCRSASACGSRSIRSTRTSISRSSIIGWRRWARLPRIAIRTRRADVDIPNVSTYPL